MGTYLPAVEVTRGPLVESVHAAAVAVAGAQGAIVARLGGVEHAVFLRSAAKPFQAIAVLESGAVERFRLSTEEIAVMTGSHNSEPDHLEAVSSLLGKIGLDASALQCGTHVPFSRKVAEAYRREGRPFTALENNCSGKHAGMLAAALAGGHQAATYLDPSHPVQQRILGVMADMTGRVRDRIEVAIDGCGVPTFGVTLAEAARAFARLLPAGSSGGPHAEAASRVVEAMRAHPLMVAGRGMLDTALTAHPRHRMVAKRGAEGVQCVAFQPDQGGPLGLAAKIGDGDNGRARVAIACEALRQLGILEDGEAAGLSDERETLVVRNNAGREVGRVRPAFVLNRT
ncbi:MAG: asparaginase [Candidatus Polarisedimenticolia bacterium]